MSNPSVGVPRAMIGSILVNGVMGFAFIITLLFCMGDLDSALSTTAGFPIIQIFYNVTWGNLRAASALTSAIIVIAVLSTIPLVCSASRTFWALARDSGLPFSHILSQVNKKRGIPTLTVFLTCGLLALLGLLNSASTSAFNAILSLSVIGLYISYVMAVITMLYRRLREPGELQYGPFRLGRAGVPVNVISILYTLFTSVFLLFPPYRPVTALNMNYACVVLPAVLAFSGVYWLVRGRKVYRGPLIVEEILGLRVTREEQQSEAKV